MSPALRLGTTVMAGMLLAPSPLSGHSGITAVVTITPGRPVVGEACQISVVAIGPTGAMSAAGQRVTLIGEMSGHPMPPLRAGLQPAAAKGRYAGALSFSMAGPWKMTLEVEHLGETMWATFAMTAGDVGDNPGAARRYDLELLDPVRATLFQPAWVVLAAMGLTAAAEGTAVAFRARRRQKGRTARQADTR